MIGLGKVTDWGLTNAKHQNILSFSKCQKATFFDEGSGNWRKAVQRFREHEKSIIPREATMKIAAMSSSTPIVARLHHELVTQQEFNKDMLLNLLSCVSNQLLA